MVAAGAGEFPRFEERARIFFQPAFGEYPGKRAEGSGIC